MFLLIGDTMMQYLVRFIPKQSSCNLTELPGPLCFHTLFHHLSHFLFQQLVARAMTMFEANICHTSLSISSRNTPSDAVLLLLAALATCALTLHLSKTLHEFSKFLVVPHWSLQLCHCPRRSTFSEILDVLHRFNSLSHRFVSAMTLTSCSMYRALYVTTKCLTQIILCFIIHLLLHNTLLLSPLYLLVQRQFCLLMSVCFFSPSSNHVFFVSSTCPLILTSSHTLKTALMASCITKHNNTTLNLPPGNVAVYGRMVAATLPSKTTLL